MDIDFEALKSPISEGDPCGPDLDMEDDDEFLMFDSDMEARVPSRFAEFFELKAENPNLDGEVRRCFELLERSRDLRLCVWLAKLVALQGELDQFLAVVDLIRSLVDERWESVNPKPLDGDVENRMNALQRLDERASVELPLQYINLVRDPAGSLRFRDVLVALDEVQAREGERMKDQGQIDTVLAKAELDNIIAGRDQMGRLRDDLAAIRERWIEHDGYDNAIKFEQLPPILQRMFDYLDEAVARRDPSLAVGGKPAEAEEADEGGVSLETSAPVGAVTSTVDAIAALAAAAAYFERHEPTSPARLLVKQAQDLVGLPFSQVLEQIAPSLLSYAVVKLRGTSQFTLSIETLGGKVEAVDRGDGEEPSQTYEAATRANAAALMQEVAVWFRAAEPSSPIPAILDRARDMMTKDFSALLAELIPPDE